VIMYLKYTAVWVYSQWYIHAYFCPWPVAVVWGSSGLYC